MSRSSLVIGGISMFAMLGACAGEADPQGGGGTVGLGGAGGTTPTTGGSGSGFGGGDSGGAPPIGGGCASSSTKAEPIPLDIFIMLDQSGSMTEDAGNALSKWQTVRAAITEFVQSDSSDGIGVGIQYFGLPQPSVLGCTQIPCTMDSDCTNGCTVCFSGVCHSSWGDEDTCEAGEYAWAEVPIEPLPGVANSIISSLSMHGPGTNTPTLPALQGAVTYSTAWAVAHPDHVTVIAFATDGDPAICGTDLNVINGVAADAFNASPSIKTFVIGVGGSLDALDGIAAAGGTVEAFNVDYDDMATEQFVQALNTIRGAALPCTYQIPPPPDGRQLDFGLVNVEYTPSDGSGTVTIPKVESEADCPPDGNAWYYDVEAAPTQIILCGTTCDAIAVDLEAEVDIALGCQTIVR